MDLVEHLSPNIVKDEPYAFYEGYLSYCCRFAQLVLSMPPLYGVEIDLDKEVEFGIICDDGPSNDVHHRLVVYTAS